MASKTCSKAQAESKSVLVCVLPHFLLKTVWVTKNDSTKTCEYYICDHGGAKMNCFVELLFTKPLECDFLAEPSETVIMNVMTANGR